MPEFRNSRCLGTSLCVCVRKWKEVRPTGQRLPGVCTLLDSLFLRLPCHCLHMLCECECKKRSEKSVRDVALLPLALISVMRAHMHTGLFGSCEKRPVLVLDLGQGLVG